MMPGQIKTWVTIAVRDEQVVQALVLGRSLRRVVTKWNLVVITTQDVAKSKRALLKTVFDDVIVPDGINQKNGTSDELYCKIYCWNLPFVKRFFFLQPDTLVLKNFDELLDGQGFSVGKDGGNRIDPSVFVSDTCPDICDAFRQISCSKKISTDLTNILEYYWPKDCNQLEDGILFNTGSEAPGSLRNVSNARIVRIPGVAPYANPDYSKLVLFANYSKSLFQKWMDVFEIDVKPLLQDDETVSSWETLLPNTSNVEPIAIVGMACRLPGANNLNEFWKLLIEGGDGIRTVPEARIYPGSNAELAKNMKAGFLNCPVDEFDGKFFGISPMELSFLDPQTRILLEVLWEALEDSAINPLTIKGTNAGIFTGAWTQDYKELVNQTSIPTDDFFRKYMGNSFGASAGRLSFILGSTGPNIATESGCSSSMVAVDLACKALRLGDTNLAMACGVNLVLHQFKGNEMEAICAKDGHCKTFDASADGFGRAEGCGVLVLKKYSDAVRDGDNIHAIIKGMGSTQEGTSRSLGTPTVECEANAMKMALKNAGVKPWEVSYVESHGTGTPVGDPMEMAAIAEAYSEGREKPLIVGSVKTNVGHTESCSGITGIIKTVLSLQNQMIPMHRNFEKLNPNVNLDAVPAIIPHIATAWPRVSGKTRYAGVSSFGITGTDAHAILQESPLPQAGISCDFGLTRPQHVLTASAKSEAALEALLRKYKSHFDSECSLEDTAFTANTGRAHFNHRVAIVGRTSSEIAKKIEKKSYSIGKVSEKRQKICFLFTGQGSQYTGMGKQLYETSPDFRLNFDNCEAILRRNFNISILPILWPNTADTSNKISQTIYSQTSIFCIEYCLLKLWESWGIKPDCVLGHSLGEFAAATAAGILSLEEALTLVGQRSRLIDSLPGGQMIVLKENKSSVDEILKAFQGNEQNRWLDFAAVNSDEQTVLAGDTETVQQLSDFCKNNKIKAIILEASHAFHSRHMNPMLEEYGKIASKVKANPATCTFISGVEGNIVDFNAVNSDYWIRHTRESVKFKEASKIAYAEGCRLFLEIGPQPVLSALTIANSSDFETKEQITCLPSLRRNADEWTTILSSLSKLYVDGTAINWNDFDQYYGRRKVTVPTYPFQRKKFWFDSKSNKGELQIGGVQIHPLLGCAVPNATASSIYHGILDLSRIPYVKDHLIGDTVIYPASAFLEMSMAGGYSTTQGLKTKFEVPSNPISFENFKIEAPLQLVESEGRQVQVTVTPDESSGSNISVFRELTLEDGTQKWIRHTSGKFLPYATEHEAQQKMIIDDLDVLRQRIPDLRSADQFYDDINKTGLNFGPIFKSIKSAWKNLEIGELFAEIEVPESSENYLCHPVVLDAMIQAHMMNKYEKGDTLEVPIRIEKFIWFGKLDTPTVYAHSFRTDDSKVPTSVALYSSKGKLLALMIRPELAPTTVETILNALKNQKIKLPPTYQDVWRSLPGPLENRADMWQSFGDEILSEHFITSNLHYNDSSMEDTQFFPHINRLCFLYIQRGFHILGWEPEIGEVVVVPDFAQRFSILKIHERLVNRLFMILGEEGLVSGVTNPIGQYVSWTVNSLLDPVCKIDEDIKSTMRILSAGTPQVYGTTDIVIACAENLAGVLQGNVSAVELLFTNKNQGEETRAETFYRTTTLSRYQHQPAIIRELLSKHMDLPEISRGVLQILEVGAGTGSLTKIMLPILEELNVPYKYTYTDVSSGFFMKAEKVFQPYSKKMTFKVFDMEKDPIEQGFSPQQFDIIVNVNVLHICKDLSQCMKNLRQITAPGGLVYVSETTIPYREIDLIFGLFEGYWRYEDVETRPNHCIISGEIWRNIFCANGFESAVTVSAHENRGGVTIGRASRNFPIYTNNELQKKPKSWIIFSSVKGTSNFFSLKLKDSGRSAITIEKSSKFVKSSDSEYAICPFQKDDMMAALSDIASKSSIIEGIIYLWGDDEETNQKLICEPFLYLSQIITTSIFKPLPKLFILTNGVMQVGDHVIPNPAAATLGGFARSLRAEFNHLYCKAIDMDPTDSSESKLEEVFREMWNGDSEIQVCFRQRARNVVRINKCKFNMAALTLPNSEKFALALPSSKAINDLRIVPKPTIDLKEDEVEVQNKAVGLNFKDILAVLKPIKEFESLDSMGADFAGVITAVGSNVKDRKVGDRVFGCNFKGGAIPNHNIALSSSLVSIPEAWTFSEAATLPVVFATAYYCMVLVADLKANETILIHAGSGGVGLVAIQLAKHLGVKIITTAGNRRKRVHLRNLGIKHVFNSRTLNYEQQIQEATNGKGVNMVLNCLTGPGFKEASLNACAPGARFVEMSKIDIWEPEQVSERRPDVKYSVVDLTVVSVKVWSLLISKMDELVKTKALLPIPTTTFDLVYVREALYYLQKAKHIGKVVVELPDITNNNGDFETKFNMFNDKSSYLITGGLGGIGLEVAKWMCDSGAKHVVLVGRNLPNAKASNTIESLRQNEKNVIVLQADIGDVDQCQKMLDTIRNPESNLPPLRGIMHAAGTISDNLLEKQSWSTFTSTFNPKVNGGWNLHNLTKEYPLEHFVMFSSVVALLGNGGQTNHAAANAFLDSLAFHRNSIGLPALTVNWGQWGEVGVAADMKVNGIRAFSPKEAILAMESMMKSHKIQGGVIDADFSVFRKLSPSITKYTEEVKHDQNNEISDPAQTIDSKVVRQEFESASDDAQKLEVIKGYVQIIIKQILKLDDEDEIDCNQNLSEVGLDSLMIVELKNSLQAMVGNSVTLEAKVMVDLQNVQVLSEYIVQLMNDREH